MQGRDRRTRNQNNRMMEDKAKFEDFLKDVMEWVNLKEGEQSMRKMVDDPAFAKQKMEEYNKAFEGFVLKVTSGDNVMEHEKKRKSLIQNHLCFGAFKKANEKALLDRAKNW